MSVELLNPVSAPKSLDAKFFQEVLENALLETHVQVKQISFEMGCVGGDNYCSKIYRTHLTFHRGTAPLESLSVIVKSIVVTESMQFLEELSVFLKEKIFYNNILPRMEILLDKVKFGPKLYHTLKEPICTLAFEDLSALGYVMADREKGLDLEHCKLALQKLGQFHGISIIVHMKEPALMNTFNRGMLDESTVNKFELYEAFFGGNIDGLIRTISKWEGYEAITEKVSKYRADLKRNLINSQLPIPGELKVLNHGDAWVNNLLFKYQNGNKQQVEEVVFVDLQMSIFGSPGYDINYFLNTSVALNVLKEKRQELIETYHTAMSETLRLHNYKDIPSLEDILTEVRRRERYGFFASFGLLPTMSMDREQSGDNNLEQFMDEDYAKKKIEIMFTTKRVEETLRYALKRFDELGIFD